MSAVVLLTFFGGLSQNKTMLSILKAKNVYEAFTPWLFCAKISGIQPFSINFDHSEIKLKYSFINIAYTFLVQMTLWSALCTLGYTIFMHRTRDAFEVISFSDYFLILLTCLIIQLIHIRNTKNTFLLINQICEIDKKFFEIGVRFSYSLDKQSLLRKMVLVTCSSVKLPFHLFRIIFSYDASDKILRMLLDHLIFIARNLGVVLIGHLLNLLWQRYQRINRIISERYPNKANDLRLARLRTARRLYDDLLQMSGVLETTFGVIMTLNTLVCFVIIVVNSYYTYVSFHGNWEIKNVLDDAFAVGDGFWILLMLIRGYGCVTSIGAETPILVHRALLTAEEEPVRREVCI